MKGTTMANKKILVIGSSNMDAVLTLSRVPNAGENVTDEGGLAYVPGGRGGNAAVTVAKNGGDCVFSTRLGADVQGQKLYSLYREVGINTAYIKIDPTFPTGLTVVMSENGGGRRSVIFPGANGHLSRDNIAEAMEMRPDAVYIGFEVPFNTLLAACQMAERIGVPVFADAAGISGSLPLDTLPRFEVFSPNEEEMGELSGIKPYGVDSSLRASLMICKRVKAKYIVIKLGERGCFIYDGKYYDIVPAFAAKATDPAAAGDAFTAALTLEYMRNGGKIIPAARYANAVAAITVTRPGASQSIPDMAETQKFMGKHRS